MYIPGSADPQGCYVLPSHVTIPGPHPTVEGDGGRSRIVTLSATDDVFVLGDGATELDTVLIRDLTVWSDVPKTAGAAFRAASVVGQAKVRNVLVGALDDVNNGGNRLWDGFLFRAAAFGQVDIEAQVNVQHVGIAAVHGTALRLGNQSRITGCAIGLWLQGDVGGTVLDGGTDISGCRTAVQADTSLNPTANRELTGDSTVSLDSGAEYGIHALPGGLGLLRWHGWAAAIPRCIAIDAPQPAGATYAIDGAWFGSCAAVALAVDDGNLVLSGTQFHLNGTASRGSEFGSVILGSDKGASITGNRFGEGGPRGENTGYDFVAAPAADHFIVTGNLFTGRVEAGAPGPTRRVADNIGYATEATGQFTAPPGPAFVLRTGLAGKPGAIQLTPAAQPDPACPAWVDAATAAPDGTVTVRFACPARGTRSFYWNAAR